MGKPVSTLIGGRVLASAKNRIPLWRSMPDALAGLVRTLDDLTTPEGRFDYPVRPGKLIVAVASVERTIIADVPLCDVPSLVGRFSPPEGHFLIEMALRQGDYPVVPEIVLGMMAKDFVIPVSSDPNRPVAAIVAVFQGNYGGAFDAWLPPPERWLN